jgi:Domain of unknown function (DUF202)
MKFGLKLKNSMFEKFAQFYISYDDLKETVKLITGDTSLANKSIISNSSLFASISTPEARFNVLILNELKKVDAFTQIESDAITETARRILRGKRGFASIGWDTDLILLDEEMKAFLEYIKLNFEGFRKICKKFDRFNNSNHSKWFMEIVKNSDFLKTVKFMEKPMKAISIVRGHGRDVLFPRGDLITYSYEVSDTCVYPEILELISQGFILSATNKERTEQDFLTDSSTWFDDSGIFERWNFVYFRNSESELELSWSGNADFNSKSDTNMCAVILNGVHLIQFSQKTFDSIWNGKLGLYEFVSSSNINLQEDHLNVLKDFFEKKIFTAVICLKYENVILNNNHIEISLKRNIQYCKRALQNFLSPDMVMKSLEFSTLEVKRYEGHAEIIDKTFLGKELPNFNLVEFIRLRPEEDILSSQHNKYETEEKESPAVSSLNTLETPLLREPRRNKTLLEYIKILFFQDSPEPKKSFEGKTYLANERTFLDWLYISFLLSMFNAYFASILAVILAILEFTHSTKYGKRASIFIVSLSAAGIILSLMLT